MVNFIWKLNLSLSLGHPKHSWQHTRFHPMYPLSKSKCVLEVESLVAETTKCKYSMSPHYKFIPRGLLGSSKFCAHRQLSSSGYFRDPLEFSFAVLLYAAGLRHYLHFLFSEPWSVQEFCVRLADRMKKDKLNRDEMLKWTRLTFIAVKSFYPSRWLYFGHLLILWSNTPPYPLIILRCIFISGNWLAWTLNMETKYCPENLAKKIKLLTQNAQQPSQAQICCLNKPAPCLMPRRILLLWCLLPSTTCLFVTCIYPCLKKIQ